MLGLRCSFVTRVLNGKARPDCSQEGIQQLLNLLVVNVLSVDTHTQVSVVVVVVGAEVKVDVVAVSGHVSVCGGC